MRARLIHRMSGAKEGALFESRLKFQALAESMAFVKIPTGAKPIGSAGGRPTLIPVKTPFDFVFAKNGRAAFIDAKSISDKRFGHAQITPHQLIKLAEFETQRFSAGYVVNFREEDQVVFFPAKMLMTLKKGTSLSPNDGIVLGNTKEFKLAPILRGDDLT